MRAAKGEVIVSQAGLKAGLVGGAVAAVVTVLGAVVPCVGCLTWFVYIGAGALAAYWLVPPRSAGDGAGAGAIAGVITGIVSGIFSMIMTAVMFTIKGGAAAAMGQLPPEAMRQLTELGIDPRMFASIGGVLVFSAVCCVIGFIIAAVLGAIGGLVFAMVKSE